MRVPGDDGVGSFPTIEDFAVRFADTPEHTIEFVSREKGRLAHFPAWEHADRDLRHFTAADVPLGTINIPYDDVDDNWRIIIFEHKGFIYVLEADDPLAEDFKRWFRVARDRYLQSWAMLIDVFNQIKPLDDV